MKVKQRLGLGLVKKKKAKPSKVKVWVRFVRRSLVMWPMGQW